MPKQEAEKHPCKLSNRQTWQCQEAEKHPRVIAAQIFQLSWTEEKPEVIKRVTTVLARWQLSTHKILVPQWCHGQHLPIGMPMETIYELCYNCWYRSVRLEAIEKSQTAARFLRSVCLWEFSILYSESNRWKYVHRTRRNSAPLPRSCTSLCNQNVLQAYYHSQTPDQDHWESSA